MRESDSGAGEVADDPRESFAATHTLRERDHALALVGQIYDAALDPTRWSDVVRDIVEFVGGAKGLLFAASSATGDPRVVFPFGLSESFLQRWHDAYPDDNPWLHGVGRSAFDDEGNVVLGTDFVSDAQCRRSAAYRKLAKHEKIGQLCTGVVFGARSVGVPPTQCSAFRSFDDERFTERERERMRVLVPHLSRALGVMFRLRRSESIVASSLAALDRLASGVLLLDERRHAIFVNHSAHRTLEERDGLFLRSAQFTGGRWQLLAHDAATQARVDEAIRDCLDERALVVRHFSRAVAVRRSSAHAQLTLQFAPLPRANEYAADGRPARVIVFLNDPAAGGVDAGTLARLYRLTPSESRLAVAIGRGQSLADAAKLRRTTVATARSQLASVFAKTGTTRQADLVRLLVALGSTIGERT